MQWQPIPIHTMPENEDYLLAMKKPCDKYDSLLKDLLKSPEFVGLNKKYHDLYAYLSRNTGTAVKGLEQVRMKSEWGVVNALLVGDRTLDWSRGQ